MRPEPEMIPVLIDAARALKGSRKRVFMARTVAAMGRGGKRWAQVHLGWCRETIRKGTHELLSGMTCADAFHCRRRKPAEEHLPRLLDDIRAITDGQSQADPKFQTNRLFTRINVRSLTNPGPRIVQFLGSISPADVGHGLTTTFLLYDNCRSWRRGPL